MEHLLPGMEPPKRTNEEKNKSLQVIQHTLNKKKRAINIPYISVLLSTVAVLFLLIVSFQSNHVMPASNTSSSTSIIETIYAFEQGILYDDPRMHMTKWYNLDKVKLNDTDKDYLIESFKNEQQTSEFIPPITSDSYIAFIAKYTDGTEHFYEVDAMNDRVINRTTNSLIPIEREIIYLTWDIEKQLDGRLLFILQILLLAIAYALYMVIQEKVSPIRKLKMEQQSFKSNKPYLKGVGFYFGIAAVISLSTVSTAAVNILFIFSFYTLFLLVVFMYRRFFKGEHYSYLEIPISIVAYTIFTLIYLL